MTWRWTRTLLAVLVLLLLGSMPLLQLAVPATASPPLMAQLVVAPFGVAVLLIRNLVSIPYLGPLLAFLAVMALMASTVRKRATHPLLE